MSRDFEALAQAGVRGLRAYDPGHDLVALRREAKAALTELGANENSHGASPLALEAARAALADVWRYPDPLGGDLKRALARHHGVRASQIVLGNGSHELLMQFAQAFAGPGEEVVASRHGFAVYALAAQAAGAKLVLADALPRDTAMPLGHDLDALAAALTPRAKLVYLANPNNPTGTWFSATAFAAFMRRVPPEVIVVVDEAYAEYVDAPEWQSAVALLPTHPNLVVTRTFSKAHALAGLRVGYALAHAEFVAVMERLRQSFNVNMPGLAAAEASLADPVHLEAAVIATRLARGRLAEELRSRGYRVWPSQTNFLLVAFGSETPALEACLLAQGVVPRPMAGYGLPECLRITVGDAEENARLLAALDACRSHAHG
ncbi:histidinol-phosphate transaminase [Lysobacter pythonis]|uniref:Histidinol-phosphate aminotransferase n=1 Tax=Solilutibacter pythonis TaxID=2483112 RepID=A0A3M2I4F7_9GAMM|nr:histidinol-phosphate transaminase [Lysobacter pythonis]RMH94910.1 histidinol-phosphate transaminase [Lysobacter pythonis]